MRKKLFAILMSAMMMVTFMPAMAFAEGVVYDDSKLTAGYTSDYSAYEMSYNGGVKVSIPTKRVFNTTNGTICVGVVKEVGEKALEAEQSYASEILTGMKSDLPEEPSYYYNLTNAKMALSEGTFANSLTWELAYSKFEKVNGKYYYGLNKERLVLAQPTDVKKYYDGTEHDGTGKTSDATVLLDDANVPESKWTLKFEVTGWDPTNVGAQTVTVTPDISGAGTYTDILLTGSVAPTTITVTAKTLTEADIHFYVDAIEAGKNIEAAGNTTVNLDDGYDAYDGAEHKIVNNTVDGYTVTYKKFNTKTAGWDVADVAWKNAGETGKFKAEIVKDSTKKVVRTVTFDLYDVDKAGAPSFEFAKNDATGATATVFDVEEGFDALKYIVVNPAVKTTTGMWGREYQTDADKAKTAANKKATAADEALLLEYFNDYFTVVQTPAKYEATKINAVIKAKTLTPAEEATLAAKYAKTIANNFAKPVLGSNTEVTFNVVAGGDIEWVKAPLTKKYHNKKGTLKKTYTFQVEAKADTKVTYKLSNGGEMIKIDKNTGKVTVKKGLKVGTYKVAITAKAGKATETYTLTIKMAKK